MGIKGLLPLLKSIQKPSHLRDFAGQTIGIDAYGWLHRGTISCAVELAQDKPTRKHIEFALNKVRMLIHFGVTPYLVFDGDYLPSKTHTEKGRAVKRRESKKLGLEMLRMGRSSQAQQELQKAIDVTPTMARELIEGLKQLDVQYIVAPYEADSQLAYLEKKGIISGVLSEDSDLLVFGVKCLLTKLDQYGECIMVNREHFTACRDISLTGWSDKEFRVMAMLSGCDYLPGIGGMGLMTAYRLVRKYKTVDRIVRTVQFDGKMKIPPGYLDAFTNAERTFLYQWVFCPETQSLRNLVDIPPNIKLDDMPFIGKNVAPDVAAGVACGDLDPNTKEPIVLPNRFHPPARRTSSLHTPSEKGGKPISEYFKAHRTPLAELDPNSFAPSPSQRRLLETQGNVSWSASQVPTSRLGIIDRFNRTQVPASAPQAFRRMISDPSPLNRRASPKRQRLCSDAEASEDIVQSRESHEPSTSPFFKNQPIQASPSIRKTSHNKKREEFELWSDDSVAEATAAATSTLQLTQTQRSSSPRKRKKIHVFTDSPRVDDHTEDEDASQVSIDHNTSDDSQLSKNTLTPSTSFSSLSSGSRGIFSQRITTNHDKSKSQDDIGESIDRRVQLSSECGQSPQSNRLQLLNKFAFQQEATKEQKAVRDVHATTHNMSVEPTSESELEAIGTDDEQLRPILHAVADQASSNVKGSEDLLVPSSPEVLSDEGSTKSNLCLSKFAFAA